MYVFSMDKVSGNSKRESAKEDEPGAKGSTQTGRAEPSAKGVQLAEPEPLSKSTWIQAKKLKRGRSCLQQSMIRAWLRRRGS